MRIFTLAFVFVFSIFVKSQGAEARTWEEIKKSGIIKIAADGATPPFNYYQGKKLVGFEIDLAEQIAKSLGLKVEWKV